MFRPPLYVDLDKRLQIDRDPGIFDDFADAHLDGAERRFYADRAVTTCDDTRSPSNEAATLDEDPLPCARPPVAPAPDDHAESSLEQHIPFQR